MHDLLDIYGIYKVLTANLKVNLLVVISVKNKWGNPRNMAYNLFPPSQGLSSDTYYKSAICWAVGSYEKNQQSEPLAFQ